MKLLNRFVHRCCDCGNTFTYKSFVGWPDFSRFQCNDCFKDHHQLQEMLHGLK